MIALYFPIMDDVHNWVFLAVHNWVLCFVLDDPNEKLHPEQMGTALDAVRMGEKISTAQLPSLGFLE